MKSKYLVYRHFDNKGKLLYVGASQRSHLRQQEHLSRAEWRDLIARIELTRYESKAEAQQAEIDAIRRENPHFNRLYNNEAVRSVITDMTKIYPMECVRCGHDWYPKKPGLPARCPKCSNPPTKPRVYKVTVKK